MAWTEARVETLRKLWGEGLTQTQCGERLGVTRGAISGAIDRHGLTRSPKKAPAAPVLPAGVPPKPPAAQPLRLRRGSTPMKPKRPPAEERRPRFTDEPASRAAQALLGAAAAAESRCDGYRAAR